MPASTHPTTWWLFAPGLRRLRGTWKKKFPDNPCLSARPQMTHLNIKRLESKGWRKKKGERRRKTGPQLSHDKPSFPDDVNSRSMKNKARDVEFCCKHNSEDVSIFLKNHIANFMCFQIVLKVMNDIS